MKKNIFLAIFFCVSSFLNGSTESHQQNGSAAFDSKQKTEIAQTATQKSLKEVVQFRIDQFTQRRGQPRMIGLRCNYCKSLVMDYQKDGPGRLLRCYLDRIHAPKELAELQKKYKAKEEDKKKLPWLKCPEKTCQRHLGQPFLYTFTDNNTGIITEKRLSYKLLTNRTYIQTE